MPYLNSDIIGSASRIHFGRKGDLVTIFADHGNVKIVENSNGFRFSVNEIHLSNKKVEPDIQESVVIKAKKKK